MDWFLYDIGLRHERVKKMKYIRAPGHIKKTVVLIFGHFQCLNLMFAELAWVLVSSGTQVQPQITLNPGYLPDYISVLMTMQLLNTG